MLRFTIWMAGASFALFGFSSADAQLLSRTVYHPAPATTVVQPAPIVQTTYAQPATVVYRPVVAPVAQVYAAPQPVVVARPTIPVTVATPAPVITQRYRPILGGTVTRVRYP